ncbi:MAG TPA: type II toxin-antitoxin system RelE/ParE family toxin [Terriglobia bacterium]|nr:type II toxin-antitoxin system RelE/ParE family toxin [Terriglobia bacterium]
MSYSLFILRQAQKELSKLPGEAYIRIREAVRALAQEPRPSGCRKLTARDGWRVRVGDYRVIYEIDNRERRVTILHVGHRRDVYRQ